MDRVQKGSYPTGGCLDLLEGHSVDTRAAVIGASPVPSSLQRVSPIDPVVQRLKPELRLSLGLLEETSS
jgi:hypothetical protein